MTKVANMGNFRAEEGSHILHVKKERGKRKKNMSSAHLAPAIRGDLVQSSSMQNGAQPCSWGAAACRCWQDS